MLRRDLKRKQRDIAAGNVVAVYRASSARKRRRVYTPGRDRVAGFYGRYSGINAELKFFDLTYDDAVVSAAGTVDPSGSINRIGQGVTEVSRIGRKCTIKSIDWKYAVTLPTQDAVALPITGDTVRVMLYLDKQCNGAIATVSGANGLLTGTNIHSHLELTNKGRFKILYDKLHNINYSTLTAEAASVHSQAAVVFNTKWYKTCNIPLEFNNTTGALTEIRSNNLSVLLISQSGVAGFLSQFRLRFSDL